ncbi:hypothetical protein Q7P37_001280 [Cladosporium fusiforme]
MARTQSISQLAAHVLLVTAFAQAQDATTSTNRSPTSAETTPIRTGQSSASIGSEPTTAVNPLQLWDIANSLLSVYYPSTTISDIASLTWPTEVVIGSSTYTRDPGTASPSDSSPTPSISPPSSLSSSFTTSPSSTIASAAVSSVQISRPVTTDESTASESEPSESPEPAGYPRDRVLGIALGVVFGVLAVAVMMFALVCIHRRQKRHGGTGIFPNRRRTASPTDSEIGEWRARHPHMDLITNATAPMTQRQNRPPRDWVDDYNRLSDQYTPPVHMHPAFMHQHTNSAGTLSETNPFFTQSDRAVQHADRYNDDSDYHPGYPKAGPNATLSEYKPYKPDLRPSQSSHRRSSTSSLDRPPTPFSPMMMMQTSSPPQRNLNNTNPFTSTADDYSEDIAQRQHLIRQDYDHEANEGNDVVSPMQPPSKSPARRYSPLVHYPSWSEISEFDFTGENNSGGRGARDRRSGSTGPDGYGRNRESVVGRTELA